MRDSPYKFLDPYDVEDQGLLFGRERESRILVSDVVVSRLVVLFAATGTGKTSLINAAVRPRLAERGYATFFIRVRRDPAESVKTELAANPGLGRLEDNSLAALLASVSARLQKPIVLFFDQFEEFFIYTCRDNADAASTFIDDVATLYNKRDLGVHVVFSMREEFFVEMDAFRDVIPSIFHNESNLRLRWFDENQARDAIVLPARTFKTEIDSPLVERLIRDLWDTTKKGIEPAQLQVVCDTLWRKRTSDRITVADYERIGRAGHGGSRANIATEVLYQRLGAEFGRIETEEQLVLLERLLPQLRTEHETKALRDLDGLATALDTDKESLRILIARLEESRLIRTSIRGDSLLVELLHDYLVGRLDDLRDRVQLIWPRRLLTAAMYQYEAVSEFMPPEQLPVILQHADRLGLKRSEAEFLFRSALAHGAYTNEWFVYAGKVGVPVWDVFRNIIESGDTRGATYTIKFISELGGSEALHLLGLALERDFIGPSVLEALSQIEEVAAVEMIAGMLGREQLAPYAEQVLERIGTSYQNVEIASAARQALSRRRKPHHRKWPAARPSSHEETSVTATLLDEHFRTIIREMAFGRVIPMLGPGVNVSDHEPDATWPPAQPLRLALSNELARHLAEAFRWPADDPYDLARVSQYVSTVAGRGQLYEMLHDILDVDYPPTAIHRFLASLPAELRAKGYLPTGYPGGHQLIVSANYDDALERAFRAAGEPFDLVTYVADGEQAGKFLHWPPDGDPRLIEKPNEYLELSLEKRTVILKAYGGVDRANAERDSYVITEDDYIDYLMRADISYLLPARLAAELNRRHFLFLGYSIGDWPLRVILHRIWRRQRISYKSWSVQLSPQGIERYLWRRHNVDVLDVRLEDYVAALREHAHALEPGSRRR